MVEPQIYESGIADVAFILDTSTYSLDDDVYQNQVEKILLFINHQKIVNSLTNYVIEQNIFFSRYVSELLSIGIIESLQLIIYAI